MEAMYRCDESIGFDPKELCCVQPMNASTSMTECRASRGRARARRATCASPARPAGRPVRSAWTAPAAGSEGSEHHPENHRLPAYVHSIVEQVLVPLHRSHSIAHVTLSDG